MKPSIRETKAVALCQQMLATIEQLGQTSSARIDARLWATYYSKKIKRLGDWPGSKPTTKQTKKSSTLKNA